jgi:hypothetical protein
MTAGETNRGQMVTKSKKGVTVKNRNPLKSLVGTRGFEPLTPTASR